MLGSRMRGPLAQYASGFRDELVELGYAPSSARRQMEVMSQLSGWMMQTGLRPRELTPDAARDIPKGGHVSIEKGATPREAEG